MADPRSGSRSEGPPAPLHGVEPQLRATEDHLLEIVRSDFPFVTVLAQHLIRAGGKRLRVAMTWLGAAFGDARDVREADLLKLAAAIELTHLATLHHDDIIDEADSRRGVPSVNANWSNTLAVLSGDYLFAKSSQLAAEVGGEVPLVLASTIAALCEGQVKEIEASFRTDRSPDDYLHVIERKTARLLAASAYLGARVAGADDRTAGALRRFGTSFGIAFQVADDLLDFLGDSEQTGKAVGTDLKEGIYTLPVLHAIRERADIAALLQPEPQLTPVIKAMQELGSFGYARSVAERYAAEARGALEELEDRPERRALEALTDFVVERIPVTPAA